MKHPNTTTAHNPSKSTTYLRPHSGGGRYLSLLLLLLVGTLSGFLATPLQAARPTVPTAPSYLAASGVSSSQINISWRDNSGNESGFTIERSISATGPWMQIASTSGNATSYTDSGLGAATTYFYRVKAYNSRGSSSYSNVASATTAQSSVPSCTYSISPASASFPSGGGNGSSSVATSSGCAWTATSGATWITITAGSSGTGSGTATFSVAANTGSSSRTGTLTIAGKTFTVSQAAAAPSGPANDYCASGIVAGGSSATLTGSNIGATKEAGEPNHAGNAGGKSIWWSWTAPAAGSVTIDTRGSSFDTLLGVYTGTSVSGLTTIAGNDDIGGGMLQSSVTFNAVAGTTYQMAVDGYNGVSGNVMLNISQAPTACTYSISPATANPSAGAGSGTVAVTAGAGCSWTVSSSATSWLTCSPASGTGTGTVTWTATANTSTSSRTGTLTIAGQTFTVTQAGVACSYSIGGSSASFGSAGGSSSVNVTASVSTCTWTAGGSASWITINSGASGTGNGTVSYSVAANTGSSRTATLTIAGQPFTVSQTAATPDSAPTASLTSPSNGATISGTATFTGTANDDHGVTRVEFWCDGSLLLGTATTAPYSVTYNTANIPNGPRTFTCKAYDTTGQPGTSTPISATVNNTTTGTPGQMQFVRMSSAGFGGQAYANSMAVDSLGNVVIAGYIIGTVDFSIPGYSIPAISSSSTQDYDAFIAKYDRLGHPLWVKRLGSPNWADVVNGVTIDSQNNIVVTGNFSTTVDFGAKADGTHVTLTAAPPPSPGASEQADMFVAKYDAANPPNLLWARRFGNYGPEGGVAAATDGNNNVFVVGKFQTISVDFGNPSQPVVLSSAGNYDIVLLKLAAGTGATLWAKRWGGTDRDEPSNLAVDRSGEVVVTGTFWGTADFGGSLITANRNDIFLAKYSGVDGSHRWSRVMGNSGSDSASGVAVDPNSGNVIITGGCNGPVDFGGGLIYNAFGGTAGSAFFLAAYSSSGNYLWAKEFGDGASVVTIQGKSVAIDGNSNIAVTGASLAMLWMGDRWWTESGQGYFLASFNSSGTFEWGATTQGGTSSTGSAVAFDSLGHVLSAGYASGAVDFGAVVSSAPASCNASYVATYNK